MAAPQRPALIAATKPDNATGVTDVATTTPLKVTYVFNATSSANLSIPYAASVNGKALAAYDKKPHRVLGNAGRIILTAHAGEKVSLYLNSDAHPSYRSSPVYEVTVGERDVLVTVTEKPGKHADSDKPHLKPSTNGTDQTSGVDEYTAPLTGDIWMKVSHKYTSAEVDALLPKDASTEVIAAVKSIYSGLKSAKLQISLPAAGGNAAQTSSVTFADSDNPKNNITNYSLLADGLPRGHPAGYAALFTAALGNNIKSMELSSCWRPMLGSISHRSGLGLDVAVLGGTHLNREELRKKLSPTNGTGNDQDNVTDAEMKAFKEYEDAIVANKQRVTEAEAADRTLAVAKKSGDSVAVKAAEAQLTAATVGLDDASRDERAKSDAWNEARNAGEPAQTKLFRTSLLKCSCVRQLFDPWFMDADGAGGASPSPNMQRGKPNSNERIHANHLHITVHDPKIL